MNAVGMLGSLGRRVDGVRTRWRTPYSGVWWVGEGVEWVIDWYARELIRQLEASFGLSCRLAPSCRGVRRQVIHFASRNAYFSKGGEGLHPSNRAVLTWFRGSVEDPDPENQRMIRLLPLHASRFRTIVTASSITRERLLAWGVPEKRVALVPLGVDLSVFRPPKPGERKAVRARLGIPPGALCIGSFQKDGIGWGEGMEPKPIKGPDVLLAVLERLRGRYPVFVLLTGPARGYVKHGLERLGIDYRHVYFEHLEEVAACYRALDLCLITSRDEGGPMAVLEGLASGAPVVSTRVGMAADLIRHGRTGGLVDVGDVEGLVAVASALLDDPGLRRRCIEEGLRTVEEYGWERIAQRYYAQVYQPLLGA